MKRTMAIIAVGVVLVGALATAGCVRVPLKDAEGGRSGAVIIDTPSYALEGAEKLEARVEMGVGELSLSGSANSSDTLSTRFEYAPASWKPELSFETIGGQAKFSAEQPGNDTMSLGDQVRYDWELQLPAGIETDLTLKLGVGESEVDLRDVDVRELSVLTGVGSSKIDLSGARADDINANIECGLGETVIRVPRDMGVRVIGGDDGIGDLEASGFDRNGGELTNAAYATAAPKLEIRLTMGVGEVRVEQVP